MKSIKTNIIINASIEKVWETLMDFENHPKWNPFIQNISGNTEVGNTLSVSVQPPKGKGMTFKPIVLSNIPYKEFRWQGKLLIKGIFDGEHFFILERMDNNRTYFIHGEHFRGILVSLLGNMLEKTKEGFQYMNEALKAECEK